MCTNIRRFSRSTIWCYAYLHAHLSMKLCVWGNSWPFLENAENVCACHHGITIIGYLLRAPRSFVLSISIEAWEWLIEQCMLVEISLDALSRSCEMNAVEKINRFWRLSTLMVYVYTCRLCNINPPQISPFCSNESTTWQWCLCRGLHLCVANWLQDSRYRYQLMSDVFERCS